MRFEPAERSVLLERAAWARERLSACTFCEKRCGVDRLHGGPAPCGLGHATHSFKRHLSLAEEIELLPSYMVYFAGCNFRCAFCVQAPACFDPHRGGLVDPAALARECGGVVGRGARTINLLGGEPSLHPHTILELAAAAPEPLPLLLNSNFFMTPEVLDLFDGVVAYYLADFKFGSDLCAARVAGVDRYVAVVTRNLLLAHAQRERRGARLLVRHLLMPGHIKCCYEPVAQWMRANLPDTPFNVMDSYVPAFRAARPGANVGELARLLSPGELAAAERVTLTRGGREVRIA